MKVQQIFEATDSYGIVISRDKKTNKFEDMDLVEFNSENIVSHKPGHAQNMFTAIVRVAKRMELWNKVEPFLKKKAKSAKALGEDFGDAENLSITKYGPFTPDDLGNLSDEIEEAH